MLSAFGATSAQPDPLDIAKAFMTHGIVYAVFMLMGVVADPDTGGFWQPAGWTPVRQPVSGLISNGDVSARNPIRTSQFWLLWLVLRCNVMAGMGIRERAPPIYSNFFPSGVGMAAATAGFVAILSLANMLGRFV